MVPTSSIIRWMGAREAQGGEAVSWVTLQDRYRTMLPVIASEWITIRSTPYKLVIVTGTAGLRKRVRQMISGSYGNDT